MDAHGSFSHHGYYCIIACIHGNESRLLICDIFLRVNGIIRATYTHCHLPACVLGKENACSLHTLIVLGMENACSLHTLIVRAHTHACTVCYVPTGDGSTVDVLVMLCSSSTSVSFIWSMSLMTTERTSFHRLISVSCRNCWRSRSCSHSSCDFG